MTQKNIEEPKLSKTKCSLQIYTAFELKEILANNGFETIAQYAMDGSKFLKDSSNTILTIARKL
jgi:hypothetical protein